MPLRCRVLELARVWGLSMGLVAAPTAYAQTEGGGRPLSAIDWLSVSATAPQPETGAWPVTPAEDGTTADSGISVRALDALRPEAVGLFPAARVGLPSTLWGPTPAEELAARILALPGDMLPAQRDLAMRLLLAEFDAPLPQQDPAGQPLFLLARIDALIGFGALDQAAALLDALGSNQPVLRLRRFDIGLLLGDEHAACTGVLQPDPPIGDDAALVFCLARANQWPLAEQVLAVATQSRRLDPYMIELLEQFLDEDEGLSGSATLLPPPAGVPTPLALRLREATGDGALTTGLPVAFAHSDLRGTAGWRAQIDAAERLVRAGALAPNRLLGLYTERRAAASGGIWERVRQIQRLDTALGGSDPLAVGEALVALWPLVRAGELEVAIASLYAPLLVPVPLDGPAAAVAFRMMLLSDSYETAALGLSGAHSTPETRFLAAVARGLDPVAEGGSLPGELAGAVAIAFGPDPMVPEGLSARLATGALGAEILSVLARLGGPGDPRALAEGLGALRAMGLEDVARRSALQVLLLERNG